MTASGRQYLTSSYDRSAIPAATMPERLLQHGRNIPDKVLYVMLEDGKNETERITFRELVKRARIIAKVLKENGKNGDRVLLLFPTGIAFITSFFACFFAGMIAVPAYPPHRRKANQRFVNILLDADPAIILTNKSIRSDLEYFDRDGKYVVSRSLINFEEIDFDMDVSFDDPGISSEDIAMLQYTSGSTGRPRGVMITHGNIMHNSECIRRSFGFDEQLRGMNWLPNFHDMGLIGCLIQPAYVGGMNHIIPPLKFLQHPLEWLKSIGTYRANNAGGPNFAFEHCLERISDEELEELDLSSLSTMYCGAEPIREESLVRFAEAFKPAGFTPGQFYPCYGLAESVLILTGGDHSKEPVFLELDARALENNKVKIAEAGNDRRSLTSCGFPWMGMSIAIVDPDAMTLTPPGEIGEIWAKGPSVAKGYWNDAQGTEQTFNAYIKDTDDGPWLRTGDLGFIHEGQLYVSGRLKDLIIIRGSNFFPNDIEFSLENAHEAIRKNATTAFSVDSEAEEKLVLVAEVERTFMRNLPEDEIFEAIRTAVITEHGIQPHAIALIRTGSILKTSSGKIRRYAVKKAWLNDELTIVAAWKMKKETGNMKKPIGYRPEFLREWMINWMAQNLEIDPAAIDPGKPVSAYGLDSIAAVSLERDVNKQFGVEWPIESFLMDKSIEQLVEEGMRMLHSKT